MSKNGFLDDYELLAWHMFKQDGNPEIMREALNYRREKEAEREFSK